MIGLALKPFQMWVAGGLVALAVTSCVARDTSMKRNEAIKAVAKIDKVTSNAANLGKSAAAKSGSDSVRGQRDPTTRND